MSIWEIVLIGVALSMDAAALSMTNGMVYKPLSKDKFVAMPIFYGLSQGIMPVLGYFIGGIFISMVQGYASGMVAVILAIIGAKMIKDGYSCETSGECVLYVMTYKMLFLQAIATSIDAFAVGIVFSASDANIFLAATVIAGVTALFSIFGIIIGKFFGDILGNKAQILGGVILVLIAVKGLFA